MFAVKFGSRERKQRTIVERLTFFRDHECRIKLPPRAEAGTFRARTLATIKGKESRVQQLIS
jgi:hypothetical protein